MTFVKSYRLTMLSVCFAVVDSGDLLSSELFEDLTTVKNVTWNQCLQGRWNCFAAIEIPVQVKKISCFL